MEVDRTKTPLPRLIDDGQLPPELLPLQRHADEVRTQLDKFEGVARQVAADTSLSPTGKHEKLTAAAATAMAAVSAHTPAVEKVRTSANARIANTLATALKNGDSNRALIVGAKIADLDKAARLRVIAATLQSGTTADLATLLLAPAPLGVFAGLDDRMVTRVHDALIDAVDPQARSEVERAEFALARGSLAVQILEKKTLRSDGRPAEEHGARDRPGGGIRGATQIKSRNTRRIEAEFQSDVDESEDNRHQNCGYGHAKPISRRGFPKTRAISGVQTRVGLCAG